MLIRQNTTQDYNNMLRRTFLVLPQEGWTYVFTKLFALGDVAARVSSGTSAFNDVCEMGNSCLLDSVQWLFDQDIPHSEWYTIIENTLNMCINKALENTPGGNTKENRNRFLGTTGKVSFTFLFRELSEDSFVVQFRYSQRSTAHPIAFLRGVSIMRFQEEFIILDAYPAYGRDLSAMVNNAGLFGSWSSIETLSNVVMTSEIAMKHDGDHFLLHYIEEFSLLVVRNQLGGIFRFADLSEVSLESFVSDICHSQKTKEIYGLLELCQAVVARGGTIQCELMIPGRHPGNSFSFPCIALHSSECLQYIPEGEVKDFLSSTLIQEQKLTTEIPALDLEFFSRLIGFSLSGIKCYSNLIRLTALIRLYDGMKCKGVPIPDFRAFVTQHFDFSDVGKYSLKGVETIQLILHKEITGDLFFEGFYISSLKFKSLFWEFLHKSSPKDLTQNKSSWFSDVFHDVSEFYCHDSISELENISHFGIHGLYVFLAESNLFPRSKKEQIQSILSYVPFFRDWVSSFTSHFDSSEDLMLLDYDGTCDTPSRVELIRQSMVRLGVKNTAFLSLNGAPDLELTSILDPFFPVFDGHSLYDLLEFFAPSMRVSAGAMLKAVVVQEFLSRGFRVIHLDDSENVEKSFSHMEISGNLAKISGRHDIGSIYIAACEAGFMGVGDFYSSFYYLFAQVDSGNELTGELPVYVEGEDILITGPQGSGKSTLARKIASQSQYPFVLESDAMRHILGNGKNDHAMARDMAVSLARYLQKRGIPVLMTRCSAKGTGLTFSNIIHLTGSKIENLSYDELSQMLQSSRRNVVREIPADVQYAAMFVDSGVLGDVEEGMYHFLTHWKELAQVFSLHQIFLERPDLRLKERKTLFVDGVINHDILVFDTEDMHITLKSTAGNRCSQQLLSIPPGVYGTFEVVSQELDLVLPGSSYRPYYFLKSGELLEV